MKNTARAENHARANDGAVKKTAPRPLITRPRPRQTTPQTANNQQKHRQQKAADRKEDRTPGKNRKCKRNAPIAQMQGKPYEGNVFTIFL